MHARAPTRTPTQNRRAESRQGPTRLNASRDCDRPAPADRKRGNEATPLHRFHVLVLSLRAMARMFRLSLADFGAPVTRSFGGDQYVAESVRATAGVHHGA